MSKYIYIQADTNDGDYISELNEIDEEDLVSILPIIQQVANNFGDFGMGEFGDSADKLYGEIDNYDLFRQFVPRGEYGIHTIVEIRILEVTSDKKLL